MLVPPSSSSPSSSSSFDYLQLLFSDAIFGCLLFAYAGDGELGTTTGAGNTSSWALAIPALYKAYPGAPVVVRLDPEGVPNCTVSAAGGGAAVAGGDPSAQGGGGGVACDVVYRVNSSVVLNGSVHVHTHTLGVAVTTTFGLHVLNDAAPPYNTTLAGNVTSLRLAATVEETDIGPIAALPLDAISALLGPTVRAVLNRVLEKGVVIPSADFGVQLTGGEIQYHDGFFAVGTSFVSVNKTNATAGRW